MMIYLMRHGEIETDEKRRFIGQINPGLNENGMAQARRWQGILKSIAFEQVYCSDLDRAVQTAMIIAGNRSLPVQQVGDFREISLGRWEGKTFSSIRRDCPEEWENRGRDLADYRVSGGESFSDLQARVVPSFEAIAEKSHGHVLIVAHAGVNRVLLCHLLGMPLGNLFRLGQQYACLNLIRKKMPWQVNALNRVV